MIIASNLTDVFFTIGLRTSPINHPTMTYHHRAPSHFLLRCRSCLLYELSD